jgi:hypothetical protein
LWDCSKNVTYKAQKFLCFLNDDRRQPLKLLQFNIVYGSSIICMSGQYLPFANGRWRLSADGG